MFSNLDNRYATQTGGVPFLCTSFLPSESMYITYCHLPGMAAEYQSFHNSTAELGTGDVKCVSDRKGGQVQVRDQGHLYSRSRDVV